MSVLVTQRTGTGPIPRNHVRTLAQQSDSCGSLAMLAISCVRALAERDECLARMNAFGVEPPASDGSPADMIPDFCRYV